MPSNVLSEREIVVTRDLDAPAAKVFAAYTDPKQVPRWWGPKGGSLRVVAMDVRPGGSWRFHQRGPDGKEHTFHGKYVEVRPVTRLVYTFRTEGQPHEVTTTIELREAGPKTHLTLTILAGSKEQRDLMMKYGAAAGARMALESLASYLGTV